MFPAVSRANSPHFSFPKFFVQLGLFLALIFQIQAIRSATRPQSQEGVRLELPDNGNLRVENLHGGVIADLWNENYVSVLAITDSGQASRSPAVVQRTDTLLSVRVVRGP